MSIVRIGLSENKGFGDGYDAIFGKKQEAATKKAEAGKGEAGRSTSKKKKKPGKKK